MRSWLCSPLLALLLLTMPARAQTSPAPLPAYLQDWKEGESLERIEGGDLSLLGRGIHPARSMDTLTLACAPARPACDIIRWVYLDATHKQVFWIGPYFKMKPYTRKGKLATIEKQVERAMKDYRRSTQASKPWIGYTVFGTVFVGGVTAAAITGNLVFLGAAAGTFLVSFVLADSNIDPIDILDIFTPVSRTFSTKSEKILVDQNGWNWSVRPKKVKRKAFAALIEAIGGGRWTSDLYRDWDEYFDLIAPSEFKKLARNP